MNHAHTVRGCAGVWTESEDIVADGTVSASKSTDYHFKTEWVL